MEETNDSMMMTSHVLCENLFVTMTFAVYMLTYVSATIGAKCGEIPRFINYFFGKIDKLRTRYDVIGIIHEAFCRHLVAAI